MFLALLLIAASVFFWIDSANASPADEREAAMSDQYRAITKAAEDETVAFLTVDYTNMDPLIAKVLAGATGPFKSQYGGAKTNLRTSAQTAQAVSTGKVLFWDGFEAGPNSQHLFDPTTNAITAKPYSRNLFCSGFSQLADGRLFSVVELPMPAPVYHDGQRLPASYANFYIGNAVVLLPVFNDPREVEQIVELLEAAGGSATD